MRPSIDKDLEVFIEGDRVEKDRPVPAGSTSRCPDDPTKGWISECMGIKVCESEATAHIGMISNKPTHTDMSMKAFLVSWWFRVQVGYKINTPFVESECMTEACVSDSVDTKKFELRTRQSEQKSPLGDQKGPGADVPWT